MRPSVSPAKKTLVKSCLVLFVSFFVILSESCKKNQRSLTPEEQIAEKRKEDAAYNNSITAGVGNVFFEEKLVPNSPNQLISTILYNGDTLATYGKINAIGQLEYISATVLSKKGKSELLVTELFPSVSKSRMYSIINGKKSTLVVELTHFSKTRQSMSILNYDWNKDESVVIKQSYFENGAAIANYTALRPSDDGGNKAYNCPDPQPSEEIDKAQDNHLEYFKCGGLAWDSYPQLEIIKKAILEALDAIKKSGQLSGDQLNETQVTEDNYSALDNLFKQIKNKIKNYKFERSRLAGLLKLLEQEINKLKLETKVELSLVPVPAETDLDFDEITDDFIQQTFTVVEKSTGLPYTKRPVFIEMVYMDDQLNSVLAVQNEPSALTDGQVVFKFDPRTIPGYVNYTSLKARYSFTKDIGTPSLTRSVSLQFVVPKVVFLNGSDIPPTINFLNTIYQHFKIVNSDNRQLPIVYTDLTVNNVTNPAIGYTMLKGDKDFSIALNTTQTGIISTSFDLFYKNKKIETINATLNDSTQYYKNLVLGVWSNTWYDGANFDQFREDDRINVRADGTAIWYEARYPDGKITSLSTNVGWTIRREGANYIMSIGAQYGRITPTQLTFTNFNANYKTITFKR